MLIYAKLVSVYHVNSFSVILHYANVKFYFNMLFLTILLFTKILFNSGKCKPFRYNLGSKNNFDKAFSVLYFTMKINVLKL